MASEETVASLSIGDTAPTAAESKLVEGISAVEQQANDITIESQEDYESVAGFGRLIKQKAAQVTDFFAPMKKAAHEAHANICAREKQMLAPLVAAEKAVKKAMGDYVMEQERKRKEEEERLKKLAQEETEKKLQEALALEKNGDKDKAEAVFLEAGIIDSAGNNVVVESQAPKAEGTSTSIDWEIDKIDEASVPVTFSGVCIRPVDEKAIIKLIRAMKGQIRIPGISFKPVAKLTFRK